MFTNAELALLRLALNGHVPRTQQYKDAQDALLKKIRALSHDGLIPASDEGPRGPAPTDLTAVSVATVKAVFRPLQCAIINVFRSLPSTEWHDVTAAFATVFTAGASAAKAEATLVDFDRLTRIALGALEDLPVSFHVKKALQAALVACQAPRMSTGGQG